MGPDTAEDSSPDSIPSSRRFQQISAGPRNGTSLGVLFKHDRCKHNKGREMGKKAFPENGEGWELGGVTKRKEQCLVNSAAWGASSFPPHVGTGWMADLRGPSGKLSLNQLASEGKVQRHRVLPDGQAQQHQGPHPPLHHPDQPGSDGGVCVSLAMGWGESAGQVVRDSQPEFEVSAG